MLYCAKSGMRFTFIALKDSKVCSNGESIDTFRTEFISDLDTPQFSSVIRTLILELASMLISGLMEAYSASSRFYPPFH